MKLVWGIVLSFWGQAYALPNWQSQILGDAARLYEPVAQTNRLALQFLTPMENTGQVASADNDGVNAKVQIDGGILTSPRIQPDNLRMTICHELGHIFGGALRRPISYEWAGAIAQDGLSFLSAEAQADYYATLVCFRKMVEGEDHSAVLKDRTIPFATRMKCEQAWGENTNEALLCERTSLASFDFLNFVYDFPISLDKKATEVVDEPIVNQYPTRQCRLDTLVAGALCRTQFPMQLDRDQAASSDCPQKEARRPACWYPHHDSRPPMS